MRNLEDLPADYKGIQIVSSFNELAQAQFNPANAIVLPRRLSADFKMLAEKIVRYGGKKGHFLEPQGFFKLPGHEVRDYLVGVSGSFESEGEAEASIIIVSDISQLEKMNYGQVALHFMAAGHYFGAASVGMFHGDGLVDTPDPFERVLCCYTGAATDFACNDNAVHDGDGYFFVRKNDVFHFENGDISRHISFNKLGVEPFIHRSPWPDDKLRMLLVAENKLRPPKVH